MGVIGLRLHRVMRVHLQSAMSATRGSATSLSVSFASGDGKSSAICNTAGSGTGHRSLKLNTIAALNIKYLLLSIGCFSYARRKLKKYMNKIVAMY